MFTSVTYDENNVYFTLTDGSVLIVPRGNSTSDFDQTVIDNLVNSLELDKDTLFLAIGEKATIIATTAPFPNSKVTWSSSDETVVKVNNGEVEALDKGYAIILVQAGGLKRECVVFVNTRYVSGFVDLGLSVQWAICNEGAKNAEDYGNYYVWTENYVSNKGVGRLPTYDEFRELISNCTWVLTTINGIKGYQVTSTINGYNNRSIFFPMAGWMQNGNLLDIGTTGGYWSSTLIKNNYSAYGLSLSGSGNPGQLVAACNLKYSIRCVCD
jgi:uncharacterized protein (TIGR02145 family)